MPHYNSCTISSSFIRLNGFQHETASTRLQRLAQSAADFGEWPILKPATGMKGFELKQVHWEYIPSYIRNENELKEARIMNRRHIAPGENLFRSERNRDSIFQEGAVYGRCLVLSSGFFEWRHIPVIGKRGKPVAKKERIPYFITLKEQPEYFFMAGISRIWTNHNRNQSADTFAIVTTAANELMAKVYNSKMRMPVIFTEELAAQWLHGNLTEKEIMRLAAYQFDSNQMIAWPVAEDFLMQPNPSQEFHYDNLPPL